MRVARFKAPEDHLAGYYHCLSRVVGREYLLKEREKEQFVEYMRRYEKFGRLQVVTFCIMSNHFHILVEVPRRPEVLPTDEELLNMLREHYGETAAEMAQHLQRLRGQGAHEAAEAYRESFFCRMWDVSEFMKAVKQNFTQWYNHEHGRKGTLWEERFKSVLVEGAGRALMAMATYIDLNPIRAGLVSDPKDYRWCGYGEAVAGRERATLGLAIVAEAQSNLQGGFDRHGVQVGNLAPEVARKQLSTSELRNRVMENYRVMLFEFGEQRGEDLEGRPLRRGFSQEQLQEVLACKGKLHLGQALHCRVRYFVDGAVLGSREFVETIFKHQRQKFGARRTSGARPIPEIEACELMTCRALRLDPIG